MHPCFWLPYFFNTQNRWQENMANNKDGEVRRCIIGAMVMQLFVAIWAVGADFEEFVIQLTGSARRALTEKPAYHRRPPSPVAAFLPCYISFGVGQSRICCFCYFDCHQCYMDNRMGVTNCAVGRASPCRKILEKSNKRLVRRMLTPAASSVSDFSS